MRRSASIQPTAAFRHLGRALFFLPLGKEKWRLEPKWWTNPQIPRQGWLRR